MQCENTRTETFEFTGWLVDPEQPAIHFDFLCSKYGTFRETVLFPSLEKNFVSSINSGLSALLSLLHLSLGVSYYKCAAARKIILPAGLAPSTQTMVKSLYTDGLAEFFIRAGLPFPADISFSISESQKLKNASAQLVAFPGTAEALVAFGGGKDSYVANAIVRKAGFSSRLCSVVMSDKVEATIERTAPEPVLFLRRQLDPKLHEVNAKGAFNGHVPITAINSLMLIILGRLTGAEYVIFANERSADEPTIQLDGISANHQFSKSSMFEQILRNAVSDVDEQAPEYFSILRPFSEIWIGRTFVRLKRPFGKFTSCNKNFQIIGDDSPRWCGACAKCAFTSLILSPFLSQSEAEKIFPENYMDSSTLLPIYRELCGLTDNKPWDCVGTIDECRASLFRLSHLDHWKGSQAVTELLPEILLGNTKDELEDFWANGLQATSMHFVPDEFLKAGHAL